MPATYAPETDVIGGSGFGLGGSPLWLLFGLLFGRGGFGGLGDKGDCACPQPAGAIQLSDAVQTLQTGLCNNGKDTLRSEAAILANVNSNFGDLSRFLCQEFNGIRAENNANTQAVLNAIKENGENYFRDQLEKARRRGDNNEIIIQMQRGNGVQVAS